MCGLRWRDLLLDDPERATAWIRRAISSGDGNVWAESGTKTHQQRRVVLDAETVAILSEHKDRATARAALCGVTLSDDAFVFSNEPGGLTFLLPDTVSQRYVRLANRLGIKTTLHKLRHYSATELILAGVDIRTVGGRLGHAGGGSTTLRVYAAFVSEADQRAAGTLSARMPVRPVVLDSAERAKENPKSPYEVVAAAIRRQIIDGELVPGGYTPTIPEIVLKYSVSVGTANRAIVLLKKWNLVETNPGRRTVVLPLSEQEVRVLPEPESHVDADVGRGAARMSDLQIVHLGRVVRTMKAEVDADDGAQLRRLLSDAVKRLGGTDANIGEYELNICGVGEQQPVVTFVATAC
jgi:integrase